LLLLIAERFYRHKQTAERYKNINRVPKSCALKTNPVLIQKCGAKPIFIKPRRHDTADNGMAIYLITLPKRIINKGQSKYILQTKINQ